METKPIDTNKLLLVKLNRRTEACIYKINFLKYLWKTPDLSGRFIFMK
jgi:hypothetical protein